MAHHAILTTPEMCSRARHGWRSHKGPVGCQHAAIAAHASGGTQPSYGPAAADCRNSTDSQWTVTRADAWAHTNRIRVQWAASVPRQALKSAIIDANTVSMALPGQGWTTLIDADRP
jgi:hypothetical protein